MKITLLVLTALVAIPGGTSLQRAQGAQSAKPAFSLSISLMQGVVKTGSPITVNVVLTNTSDHKIGFPWLVSAGQNYQVDVWDGDGKVAQPAPRSGVDNKGRRWVRISGGSAFVNYLEPGKAEKDELKVSDFYALTQPGTYTIQVRWTDIESKSVVKSNKVTVTVTP